MSKPVLVIACGKSKLNRSAPIFDLYTGIFWQIYRKARMTHEGPGWRQVDSGRHPNLDVYAISAKLGVVPESMQADPYDVELVSSRSGWSQGEYPPEELGGRGGKTTVDELAEHIGYYVPIPYRDRPPIYFLGNPLYRQAMEDGGLDVIPLVTNPRGIGDYNGALKQFLAKHAPPSPSTVDLAAIVAEQTRPVDLAAIIAQVIR